jgi:hypothetical protein
MGQARYAQRKARDDEVRHEHDEMALVVQPDALIDPCKRDDSVRTSGKATDTHTVKANE